MDLKFVQVFLVITMATVKAKIQRDPTEQILIFKDKTPGPIGVMTTGAGAPIDYSDTVTLNRKLLYNEFFMESLTHLARERIPPRILHTKATGAFGYFKVTQNVTDICKAKLFSKVGKKTPVAVRFSPIFEEVGGIDTGREGRGFAIKFYTEEGNFDIVGSNFPVYTYKDPILFPSFIRALRRNPATNLLDANTFWDFVSCHPETIHSFLYIFSDRGIPDGYRYMPGFSIHTYQVINEKGEKYFVRFHFLPDAGERYLLSEKAKKIAGEDRDYAIRDLYRAIGNGNFPSWTAYIQVLSLHDVRTAGFDVFDITKILPLDKYPLRKLGCLVLNKNPVNFFAQIEQMALCPSNRVPGILGAPDKVFESRLLAYRDTQYHRLGGNFFNIPVNCPLHDKVFTYNRDGSPPVKDNMRDIPNYYPNSFHGPVAYKEKHRAEPIEICQDQPNNFDQAREFYTNGMSSGERKRLVENMLESLGSVTKFIQERVVKVLALIHPDLSQRVCEGLQANRTT